VQRFFAVAIAVLGLTAEARGGALLDAVKAGDLNAAKAAIAGGADVNEKTGLFTPLVAAIRAGKHDVAVLLLDHGADPNKGVGSNTPLSIASDKGDADGVKLLLEKGADARFAVDGLTALHAAAESGCLKCVELLVAAGADVNALTALGTPALHLAKLAGHTDIAAFIVANGYEPLRLPPIASALKTADATRGKAIYDRNCVECHRPMEKRMAPSLGGVTVRAKASFAGFDYSEPLKALGGQWSDDELNAFIAHPGAFAPGTAMAFRGLPDEGERADVILYLHSHNDEPQP
jgi:cytochrome c